MFNSILRVSVLLLVLLIAAPGAFAQAWPDVFNPFQILTLNLQIAQTDWDTIRHDTTNEIEVPALFWAAGEEDAKLLVSVRRKSSRALPSEADPTLILSPRGWPGISTKWPPDRASTRTTTMRGSRPGCVSSSTAST